LMDEDAGAARAEMASANKAARKAEQQALAKKNAEMQSRLKNVKAVTDDDVMDEDAGAARAEMAAASKTRKKKEAKKLAGENAVKAERLANVHAKTDDGDGLQF